MDNNLGKISYTCPLHPEVSQDKPAICPKCGMKLVEAEMRMDHEKIDHNGMNHGQYTMKPTSQMSLWEKLKMSMTMSMGMEHGELAGREMAKLMEKDIRNKFFVALLLSIPIILYSQLGEKILRVNLPTPIPVLFVGESRLNAEYAVF